jgi:hypothetical protein
MPSGFALYSAQKTRRRASHVSLAFIFFIREKLGEDMSSSDSFEKFETQAVLVLVLHFWSKKATHMHFRQTGF